MERRNTRYVQPCSSLRCKFGDRKSFRDDLMIEITSKFVVHYPIWGSWAGRWAVVPQIARYFRTRQARYSPREFEKKSGKNGALRLYGGILAPFWC